MAEEQELRDMFERFGRVTRVFLAKDRETQVRFITLLLTLPLALHLSYVFEFLLTVARLAGEGIRIYFVCRTK